MFHLRFASLPSVWGSYPRALLTKRQEPTTGASPPEIWATVEQVVLRGAHARKYAAVCGFDPDATSLPVTFPHVLAMPLHLKIFGMRAFPLRPMGLIHLENVIEPLAELRDGMRVQVVVKACNYRQVDAGLAFDMATEMTRDGTPVWRETCVFLSRATEPVERTGARPPRPPKAPKDSHVLAELDVPMRTAWDYARVSGDFNPIHLNDRAARYFGLRGAIVHGMWSLARSLAQSPSSSAAPIRRIGTQFLTPVQMPARVAIKEWQADGELKRALCDVRTGRVHMYAWWA